MAETRTTLNINYKSDSSVVSGQLDDLIAKAKQLQNILASVNVGGGGGGNPAIGGGASGGSSLASSLPQAERAARGTVGRAVSGGSSAPTPNDIVGGNIWETSAPLGVRNVSSGFALSSMANRGGYGNKMNLPSGMFAQSTSSLGQMSFPLQSPAFADASRLNVSSTGHFSLPGQRTNRNAYSPSDLTIDDAFNEYSAGGQGSPTNSLYAMDALAAKGAASRAKKGGFGGLISGKRGYALGIGMGMLVHGASSKWVDYKAGMAASVPIATSAEYSGDIFQYAQGMRESQAMQDSAKMRGRHAPASLGGSALMTAGMYTMMSGTPVGLAAGAAITVAGGIAKAVTGASMVESQAAIDSTTAKQLQGLRMLQSMQSQSLQLVNAQAALIPFGMGSTFGVQDLDRYRMAGQKAGYSPLESQGMVNAFAGAGGNLAGLIMPQLFNLQRYQGITAQTAGGYSRGYLPGGGYAENSGSAFSNLSLTMATGSARGIEASRRNEYINRSGTFGQRYAERGIQYDPLMQSRMEAGLNGNLKGFAATAATEHIQSFGMGMADQLSQNIMPSNVAEALMMTKIIGEGGSPLDWHKKLRNPEYMQKAGKSMAGEVPPMMRPFWEERLTGMAPGTDPLSGKGLSRADTLGTAIVEGFKANVGLVPESGGIMAILKQEADNAAKSVASFDQMLHMTAENFELLNISIAEAVKVLPRYADIMSGIEEVPPVSIPIEHIKSSQWGAGRK